MTFDDVRRIGLELPGVVEGTSYGTPALKVGKRLLARLLEDGDTLVLLAVDDIEQRMLMETQPETFFTTPHYRGYPTVLIRLARVEETQLRELLEQSWSRLATKRQLALRRSDA